MEFIRKILEFASFGIIAYVGWLLLDFYFNNRKGHKCFSKKGGKK